MVAALAAVVTFGVIMTAGRVGQPLGFRFAPGYDQAQVSLSVELPAGGIAGGYHRVLNQIEDRARDMPDIKYIETSAGSSRAGGFQGGGK